VLKSGGLLVFKWSGTRPSAADVLELFSVRPLWKQSPRGLGKIAAKAGVAADQAAAVLEAAGTTTWHHFEKLPAGPSQRSSRCSQPRNWKWPVY